MRAKRALRSCEIITSIWCRSLNFPYLTNLKKQFLQFEQFLEKLFASGCASICGIGGMIIGIAGTIIGGIINRWPWQVRSTSKLKRAPWRASAVTRRPFFSVSSLLEKTKQLQIRVLVSDGQSIRRGIFVRLNRYSGFKDP